MIRVCTLLSKNTHKGSLGWGEVRGKAASRRGQSATRVIFEKRLLHIESWCRQEFEIEGSYCRLSEMEVQGSDSSVPRSAAPVTFLHGKYQSRVPIGVTDTCLSSSGRQAMFCWVHHYNPTGSHGISRYSKITP